ncbi:MAG: hypothetical protein AAFR73_12485, partial [Pseudomonadota bacterium]
TNWSTLGSFTHALDLTAAGVFAGSTDDDFAGPGYTAQIDYFETASDPIVNEDAHLPEPPIGPDIITWYGNSQSFAVRGEAQVYANILGNVNVSGLLRLEYSHNSSAFVELNLGPDTRRLHDTGDFNIDILFEDLDGTSQNDLIEIRAIYDDGSVTAEMVSIDYLAGRSWSPDFSIDWSNLNHLDEAVQVIDGNWGFTSEGLRPIDTGYDRIAGIGDRNWDNYEVSLTFTPHDLASEDPRGRDGGGFGINTFWNGHTDNPVAGWDPKAGWEDVGSLWWDNDEIRILSYKGDTVLGQGSVPLSVGTEYHMVFSVEQINAFDRAYGVKVWEVGSPEPGDWTATGFEQLDAPSTGSFLLNAHYTDLTFGDIMVTEITGSDIAYGGADDDRMVLADASDPSPGRDEIDVFIGEAGADEFVFGEAGEVYYDNGIAGDNGEADYGLVWDFDPTVDFIRLAGTQADYELGLSFGDLPSGTTISHINQTNDAELIGVFADAFGLNLTADYFVFDNAIA